MLQLLLRVFFKHQRGSAGNALQLDSERLAKLLVTEHLVFSMPVSLKEVNAPY